MKKLIVSAFVGLSALGVGAVSCKPKAGSDVNNLGVLKRNGAALRDNWKKGGCGNGAPEKAAPEALKRAYSALPVALQLIFTLDDFKLSSFENVAKVCSSGLNAAKGAYPGAGSAVLAKAPGALEGCWVAENGKGPSGKPQTRPIIHMINSPESIHNNMGALAAYAFFEFYVDGMVRSASNTAGSPEVEDAMHPINALVAERTALTESFVTELGGTQEGRASLDIYKKTLVPVSQAAEGYSALVANTVFQNFVLAEMVDSYYCSPQTWATFGTEGLAQTRGRLDEFAQRSFGFPWFKGAQAAAPAQP